MILDVGAAVVLSWPRTADDGPASVAITSPAGTVTTISGVTYSSGASAYATSYTPPTPGLYQVTWSAGTGSTADVYEDVLEVRGSLSGLISLDDARQHLRLSSSDTSDNAKIQGIIEAASQAVVDITGDWTNVQRTEWFDGGQSRISVAHQPLVQVVSCVEYYGLAAFTLTEQPLGAQTNAFAFTVDYVTGQVTRRTFGGQAANFAVGDKNIKVTYTSGRSGVVPESVQLATRELVRHLYQQTQIPGRRGSRHGDDEAGGPPSGFAIPNFVVELIQPWRRPPGIA